MIITRMMRVCYTTAEGERVTEDRVIQKDLIEEVSNSLSAIRTGDPNACLRLIMFYSKAEDTTGDTDIKTIEEADGAILSAMAVPALVP